MIVRAKVKPLEAMPAWALCCDGIRRRHAQIQDNVLTIDTARVFTADRFCPWCGFENPDTKVSPILEYPDQVLALDLFDLDEGVAA